MKGIEAEEAEEEEEEYGGAAKIGEEMDKEYDL